MKVAGFSVLATATARATLIDEDVLQCQKALRPVPQFQSICMINCQIASHYKMCDDKKLNECVIDKFPYCADNSVGSKVDDCRRQLTPEAGYDKLCSHNCEVAEEQALCDEKQDLASCVVSRFPYCNSEKVKQTIDDCTKALSPPTTYEGVCHHNCAVAANNQLCADDEDLAKCVIERFPYCGTDQPEKPLAVCRQNLNPPADYKDICAHNCEVVLDTKLCGGDLDGEQAAACVLSRFSYCTNEEDSSAIDQCKSELAPQSNNKSICEHNCEVASNHKLCADGVSLTTCVTSRFPYCNSESQQKQIDECKKTLTPPASYTDICEHNCDVVSNHKLCTDGVHGGDLASCVTRKFPYCAAGSTEDILSGCKSALKPEREYCDMCNRNCDIMFENKMCPDAISGQDLADCVLSRFPYCSEKTDAKVVDECQASLLAPEQYQNICHQNCEIVFENEMCGEESETLAECVLNRFPYCVNDETSRNIGDCKSSMKAPAGLQNFCEHNCEIASTSDFCTSRVTISLLECVLDNFPYCNNANPQDFTDACKNALSPPAPYAQICEHNCEVISENGLCIGGSTGTELAGCVLDRFPYCKTETAKNAIDICKSTITPPVSVVEICKHNCEVVYDHDLCGKIDGRLADCVVEKFPYCAAKL